MASPDRSPRAGGLPLILALFAGTGLGWAAGQTSVGFLVGLGVGIVVAVAIWLADRRRA